MPSSHANISTPMPRPPFRLVQPWGPDKARQATLQSEHSTVEDAFEQIDRLATRMVRMGVPADAIELVVIDANDEVVPRPRVGSHVNP
jgi:uncharacterized protein YbbK (DUF523 family)